MCEKHLSKAIDLSIPAMPWTLPSYVLQLFRHSCISPSMYLDWTIPDSHGKTILQFSHAYPCCLWPLPTILLQFMQSPLPVVTVVTNPPQHIEIKKQQSSALSVVSNRSPSHSARYRIKAWETDNLCRYKRICTKVSVSYHNYNFTLWIDQL